MLSSHKNNILIGLLVLGLFGLVYSFLSSRPEMIADESLRVTEVPRPEFDRVISRPSAFKPTSTFDTDAIDNVAEAEEQETGGEHLVSAMQETLAEDESGQEGGILSDTITVAPTALLSDTPDSEEMDVRETLVSETVDSGEAESPVEIGALKDPYQNPFKSGPRQNFPDEPSQHEDGETADDSENSIATVTPDDSEGESFINLTNAEVPLISEQQSGFLDLNLAEEEPIEVTLLEGDEIIIDDVNETLEKYQPQTAEVTTQEESVSSGESDVTSVSQTSMDIVSPFGVSADNKRLREQASELVVLPSPDHELMNGTDAVSLEYQASYKKLESITDKLKAANEENSALKNQFSKVADDNRKLAQIIRDIDEKIKVLTVNN